jgi:NitT/TauT family transport system substrate-binding protein
MTSLPSYSPPRRGRALVAAGVSILFATTAAACGSDDTSASSDAEDTLSIRLNWTPGGQHAPLYYGVAQGFFEDEGIDLQIEEGKGSQLAIDDVAAGNVDVAMAGTAPAILGIGQGRDIVSVGMPIGAGTYGFFVDSELGLDSVEDLKGQEVLVTPGSPETPLIPAALQAAGLSESDVSLVSVEAASKLTSYVGGRGDAMATTIPFYNAAVQAKRKSDTFLFSDLGLVLPDYSFLVSRETLKDNPELVEGFLRAAFKSISAAMDDPEAAVKALKDEVPIIDYDLELQSWNDFLPFICSDAQTGGLLGMHSEEDWDNAVADLQEYSGLDASAESTDFYTNEFFEGDGAVTDVKC